MERLTETVHRILSQHLQPGDVAIDATAGNGHDTLFLANAVGPTGRVFALDWQSAAIENTRRRLQSAGCGNVQLLHANHANIASEIPAEYRGRIAAVVFNLGYLPGFDKTILTQADSTCRALRQGLEFLKPGGVMTILAYVGHPGGLEEAEAVEDLLQTLSIDNFTVEPTLSNHSQAPRLFVVTRRENLAG